MISNNSQSIVIGRRVKKNAIKRLEKWSKVAKKWSGKNGLESGKNDGISHLGMVVAKRGRTKKVRNWSGW